jgi:hypothetical protein
MRGFLLFLALAFPIASASPSLWTLVGVATSAERVGYVHADGVTQWAWLGPKSPWPEWALVPADAALTVRAHFEAAPGQIASGFADVRLARGARESAAAFAETLTRAGWSVETTHIDTSTGDLPPRALHLCMIEGRKDGRAVRLSLERDTRPAIGSIYWAEGAVQKPIGAVAGPC